MLGSHCVSEAGNKRGPIIRQALNAQDFYMFLTKTIYHPHMTANPYVHMALSSADQTSQRLSCVPGVRRSPFTSLELFSLPNFLDQEMCDWLIKLIDDSAVPSTIVDPNGDEAFRTSSTCNLDHEDAVVRSLNAYLHAAAGIPQIYGEPLQGQRYFVGEQFKAHTDYFDVDGPGFAENCAVHGQRTWTMMIYLNTPDAGGATRFTNFKKSFQPETGKLLAWNNVAKNGLPNPDSIHHGMPVRKGSKYIITKWFRERPFTWADGMLTDQ